MWFRASLFSILAVGTALVAIVLGPYIPSDLPTKIGADAVDNILGIIASSMLAVTTFSLSTMVSAYSAATSNVTPRATRLVMEDSTTQNVLATFIGSFLYSLVGIIALSTGAYGSTGRVVLFLVTAGVIVLIVVTLLRWIDHLSRLGRVTETTERVEKAASEAMRMRCKRPHMGGRAMTAIPKAARPIYASRIGYVQHLDIGQLSHIAEEGEGVIFVRSTPGAFVVPTDPIAWANGLDLDEQESEIRACFTIDDIRSFDQDPRFGTSVLAEIASRALSPGINDPGTAIDVIGRAVRILAIWAEPVDPEQDIPFPRVHVSAIDLGEIFDDLFTPIARDGAGIVEVGIRLQKALKALSRLGPSNFTENAVRHSRLALERAEASLTLQQDIDVLRRLSEDVECTQVGPAT
ncbi:putative membrane protein [Bosea psychrotolerans]|uniref:Putative membrane protein n=2 Tax=Bosea psychrotolerans TaxID=1871628 RepID=A0A2S4M0Q9_9HYPH|nr:putative membrane protein [Bosea psychrotolerans]